MQFFSKKLKSNIMQGCGVMALKVNEIRPTLVSNQPLSKYRVRHPSVDC